MSLQVGSTFPSIQAAKDAIKTVLAEAQESWKATHSDKTRFNIICKDATCNFRIRVTQSKRNGVCITHNTPHSCGPATHFAATNTHSLQFLIPHHRAAVIDNPKISTKQLQSNERLQYSNQIPYLQAYRVKQAILAEMWGDESENFAKFPDYIKRFEEADPLNFAALDTTTDGQFQAAFFSPGGLRAAGPHIRPFTAVDGTHTKSRYRMMLLIACGIDANDQVIPLAWALVPIEDSSWWNWFLRYLKACYPLMDLENHTFISDREKGIAQAISEQFEHSIHLHCCQHIADNIQQRFGNKVRPLFWQAARAKTRDLFESKMEAIRAQSKAAFTYLKAINKTLWTTAYRSYPRYGHDTSNIIESINSSWEEIRQLPPLLAMDAIYSKCMKMVYDRLHKPQKSPLLADIPMAKFQVRLKASQRYYVSPSSNGIYQVQIPESGKKYIVNLADKECDCKSFYEYQSPCTHGIAAAKYQAEDPLSFFFKAYSTRAYRKTYSHPLPPISVEDLLVDDSIKPPTLRKQAGRPRTKRIRKGEWQRKQTRCSNCLDWGHNKRSCRGQPVSNGRRERARDWLAEVVNGELEASSGEEEDQESENEDQNDEIEQEEDDQVDEEEDSELSDVGSDQFEMDSDITYSVIEVLGPEATLVVTP